jgi:hypothetical protein
MYLVRCDVGGIAITQRVHARPETDFTAAAENYDDVFVPVVFQSRMAAGCDLEVAHVKCRLLTRFADKDRSADTAVVIGWCLVFARGNARPAMR